MTDKLEPQDDLSHAERDLLKRRALGAYFSDSAGWLGWPNLGETRVKRHGGRVYVIVLVDDTFQVAVYRLRRPVKLKAKPKAEPKAQLKRLKRWPDAIELKRGDRK